MKAIEDSKKAMAQPFPKDVFRWRTVEVCRWLDTLSLGQYKAAFEQAAGALARRDGRRRWCEGNSPGRGSGWRVLARAACGRPARRPGRGPQTACAGNLASGWAARRGGGGPAADRGRRGGAENIECARETAAAVKRGGRCEGGRGNRSRLCGRSRVRARLPWLPCRCVHVAAPRSGSAFVAASDGDKKLALAKVAGQDVAAVYTVDAVFSKIRNGRVKVRARYVWGRAGAQRTERTRACWKPSRRASTSSQRTSRATRHCWLRLRT